MNNKKNRHVKDTRVLRNPVFSRLDCISPLLGYCKRGGGSKLDLIPSSGKWFSYQIIVIVDIYYY
jgi:hypothetical protein